MELSPPEDVNDLLFRGINRGRGTIGAVFEEEFTEIGVIVVVVAVVAVVPETLLNAGGALKSSGCGVEEEEAAKSDSDEEVAVGMRRRETVDVA